MTKEKNKSKENPSKIFVLLHEIKDGKIEFKNKTHLISIMQNKLKIANSAIVLDYMLNNKFLELSGSEAKILLGEITIKICNSIHKGSDSIRAGDRQSQSLKRKLPKEENIEVGNQFMDFGSAIRALKLGSRVCRSGWNGKGMHLKLVKDWGVGSDTVPTGTSGLVQEFLPWIGMKTADDKFVPWQASQADALSEDWQIVD